MSVLLFVVTGFEGAAASIDEAESVEQGSGIFHVASL